MSESRSPAERSATPTLRARTLLSGENYRNLCTGNCRAELYSLDKNRIVINTRLVLEIVLDRPEGSRTHANIWFDQRHALIAVALRPAGEAHGDTSSHHRHGDVRRPFVRLLGFDPRGSRRPALVR